ncbi:hypothetical protein PUNSTDRAFT_93626 [Punctularia strigosozonata HHB-11173 SS5]|uniref:BTB domain-containing protein n=1 Tax=Punctularia strigosozonata (strain HHB-11173) TaxID=741275 RepID=R7S268_PUNST|nr:uncharacterized protein PUNSTDRAFT_93626 [Punctularia strigosozonata HHB-11173 SS5]EIN03877.1 hypothetical protein PUNSTDRAFT_93626 [Punctularia strigosozonata HHB-11173 SS5]
MASRSMSLSSATAPNRKEWAFTYQATSPAFNFPDADVILRTPDHVEFRAHKLVLSLASPVFRNMFASPQVPPTAANEGQDWKDGLPVVALTEPASVLDALLRLCYPLKDPQFSLFDQVTAALEGAMKYEMDEARDMLRGKLKEWAEKAPVRAFAVACRYRWKDEAERAARAALRVPLPELIIHSQELEHISAGSYVRLLLYHKACGTAAAYPAHWGDWISVYHNDRIYLNCPTCHSDSSDTSHSFFGVPNRQNARVARWWKEYMDRAGDRLRETPLADVAEPKMVWQALARAMECASCRPRAVAEFQTFLGEFQAEIARRIQKVVLTIDF